MKIKSVLIMVLFTLFSVACGSSTSSSTDESDESGEDGNGGTTSVTDLSFDLSNAVGIVKLETATPNIAKVFSYKDGTTQELDTTQPYKKMTASGLIQDFITSIGTITVSDFYINPSNGDLYLILSNATDYTTSSANLAKDSSTSIENCILIKIIPSDNTFECVDSELSSVSTTIDPPIQFDDNGGIYYVGTTSESSTSDKSVLRRKTTTGTITDYINDYITVSSFAVAGNGVVYIYGQTTSASTRWFRKYTPNEDGTVGWTSLSADCTVLWMKEFPDNNIYVSTSGGIKKTEDASKEYGGIFVIDNSTGSIKDQCWLDKNHGNANDACSSYAYTDDEVCGDYIFCFTGSNVLFFQAPDQKLFTLIVGSPSNDNTIIKAYPTMSKYTLTTIADITVYDAVAGFMIFAGTTAEGNYKFITFNLTDDTETELLTSILNGAQFEVYHAKFMSTSTILFDGLRSSDNKYMVGMVDTSNNNAAAWLSSVDTKIDSFNVFP